MNKGRRVGNPKPAYYQLQSQIQDDIEMGRLVPGERVPPERWLAKVHKVSVGTVTKAIHNLVHDGYLYRVQGSGTFVAGTNLRRESLRYYRYLGDFGDTELDVRVRLLNLTLENPSELTARRLDLSPGNSVFVLRRLVSSRDEPLVYCISHLPKGIFEGLDGLPSSRLERIPLYMTIEEEYKLPTLLNRELISSVLADSQIASHLSLQEGEPVLSIEMLAFTYKEKPYEYRQSYCSTRFTKILREY